MENMEQYIGRKIKGFKFRETDSLYYLQCMNSFIGKVGVIKGYDDRDNTYSVGFGLDEGHLFYYPAELCIKHLIATEPTKTITKEEATALIESMTGDKYEIL